MNKVNNKKKNKEVIIAENFISVTDAMLVSLADAKETFSVANKEKIMDEDPDVIDYPVVTYRYKTTNNEEYDLMVEFESADFNSHLTPDDSVVLGKLIAALYMMTESINISRKYLTFYTEDGSVCNMALTRFSEWRTDKVIRLENTALDEETAFKEKGIKQKYKEMFAEIFAVYVADCFSKEYDRNTKEYEYVFVIDDEEWNVVLERKGVIWGSSELANCCETLRDVIMKSLVMSIKDISMVIGPMSTRITLYDTNGSM